MSVAGPLPRWPSRSLRWDVPARRPYYGLVVTLRVISAATVRRERTTGSHHSDRRLRAVPQGRGPGNRPGGARAGRVLPRRRAACARSSRSTPPPWARPSAAPGSTPTPPSRPRSPTCSGCRGRWPTRTPSRASTSAAARPSSSATRRPTRPRRCCAPTAGSCSRSAAATSPRATSAPTSRTWTSWPASARFVTGRTRADGGAGDSSMLTATACSRACAPPRSTRGARRRCAGRRVGVAGVGKVGHRLVGHLLDDGADGRGHRRQRAAPSSGVRRPASRRSRSWPTRTELVAAASTSTRRAPSAARWTTRRSPRCARRSSAAAPTTSSAHPGVEKLLGTRGILYAPDYLVNSGGVIQVADEIARLQHRAGPGKAPAGIFDTTLGSSPWRPRRASRPRWRPTGSPSARMAGGRAGLRGIWLGRCLRRRARPPAHRDRPGAAPTRRRYARDSVRLHGRCTDDIVNLRDAGRAAESRASCPHVSCTSGAGPAPHEGVEPMGRGRAKAKQTKVARELKYSSGGTDLERLR